MRYIKHIVGLLIILLTIITSSYAGNEQRIAQAGASELLINPWARSTGLGDANVANITGLESVFGNIAGSAHLGNTQLIFTNTDWMKGTDVNVSAFGLSHRIGDAGVLSLAINMLDWGEISTTTVEIPEGDGSTFQPKYTNIGVSFAKEFSNSIFGGITVRIINENISNLSATGVAFDAGIQYITGSRQQIKFGVTMKNVGPTLKIDGDGLSVSASTEEGPTNTMQFRPEAFELPSLIKLGASYDFEITNEHGLVAMVAFTENSFSKNQYHCGFEYAFRKMFMVRAGYIYEDGILDNTERTTVYTGIAGGVSLEMPLKKGSNKMFGVDYSFRDTDPFAGTHTIGIRISL